MSPTAATHLLDEITRATGAAGPDPGTVPQALTDRFLAAMAKAEPHVPPVHATGHDNIVVRAVEERAEDDRKVPNDVLYLRQHASGLSLDRMVAANLTVSEEVTLSTADLQVKMAMVNSSKDAVQTLMKNQ
ncbi:serine kinase [Paraburkholderia sp. SARCC-3016]|uniref:serine kinase n=1 Tax=Paraburkholderia sp. SARCC-3016 TaxID=3058611 RepID=UPI002807B345|nr:serine kinase [Paraburkholderia sp. SARCC-3016]MDQ7980264.1 serine kinase [Paraburkholderia sp. SARCC-3016]